MASMTKNNSTWTYTYNSDGLRTSRTNGVTTYDYVYSGDLLKQMTVTDVASGAKQVLTFTYDATGTPLTLDLDGTVYYYLTNIQGDVTGIVDSTGNLLIQYVYEGYGKSYFINDTSDLTVTLGSINPLAYRAYVFDMGTALYYLQSRYYDQFLGRFLNADAAIGQMGNVQGHNMFSYAFNNPVMYSDNTGNWPKLSTLLLGVAVAAIAVATVAAVVVSCGAAAPLVAAVTGSVVSSAAAAAAVATVGVVACKVATVALTASATAYVAEKTTEKANNSNHSVYVLKDDSGTVQYVGRTVNVQNRKVAHSANPARAGLQMEVVASGLDLAQARALEQAGMAYYHTINTANKTNNQINGIAPKFWDSYKTVAQGLLDYGWNQMSNEILYWIGC